MSSQTTPDVFIIESGELADEGRHSEGEALRGILRMMGRKPKYTYIRTARELQAMSRQFERSRCRYLHISCHGNEHAFELTLETVSFTQFGKMFGPFLKNRRVFLSACSVAQPKLARELFKKYHSAPYSVTGPCEDIGLSDAAVTWASVYNLLFRDGAEAIKGKHLRDYLNQLCKLNGVRYVHFGRITSKPYYKDFELPLG